MPDVREYIDECGHSRFADWFENLDARVAAKVVTAKVKLAAGHVGNLKPVGGGITEYRIDYGPGYRLYLCQDGGQLIVLLVGGNKASQDEDISEASRLWQEYKIRKAKAAALTSAKPSRKRR